MQASTLAGTASIEGVDYPLAVIVTLDTGGAFPADVTLAVESLTPSADITSDMPQGTRLQAGYPARSLDITLSGLVDPADEVKTAAWAFNPYSVDSPFYRKQLLYRAVTVDLGVYSDTSGGVPEVFRKFTGVVDDFTVNPTAGTVTLTCLDGRNQLRSALNLPAVVTAPPFNAGLTSEYAVDALLRAGRPGVASSWPTPRPNCVLAVGFRSSIWPEVGALDTSQNQPPAAFTAGPFGSGLTASASVAGWAAPTYVLAGSLGSGSSSLFIEGFVDGLTGSDAVSFTVGFLAGGVAFTAAGGFTVSPGSVTCAGGVGTWSTSIDSGTHYVSAKTTFHTSNFDVTFTVDSTTHTLTGVAYTVSGKPGATAAWDRAQITVFDGGTVAAVQMTTETAPLPNFPFTPTAMLDQSLNPLQVIPAISGDPWQVIQQIADAELAVAGYDEGGVFRFTNRRTLATGTVARSITSATSLKDLQIASTAASVVNRAQVGHTDWTFGPPQAVYAAVGRWLIPSGGRTFTITVPDGSLAASVATTAAVLPDGSTFPLTAGAAPSDGQSWFRASIDRSGTAEFHGAITITLTQLTSSTVRVDIDSSALCWLVSPAHYTDLPVGSPSLWIGGIPVTPDDEVVVDFQWPLAGDGGAAGSVWGEQAYQLTGNPWIQDDVTALELAVDIVADLAVPRPDLTGVEIVPDPRLQLTDRVLISDPDRSGVVEYAVLFGENLQLAAGQFTHSIDVRTVAPPGGWILGVAGRSELGVTTYV